MNCVEGYANTTLNKVNKYNEICIEKRNLVFFLVLFLASEDFRSITRMQKKYLRP